MPKPTDDIPRVLEKAGKIAWTIRGILGFVGLGVAAWVGTRRPIFTVLVLVLLLTGYGALRAWHHYEERPSRGRRVRRTPGTRTES